MVKLNKYETVFQQMPEDWASATQDVADGVMVAVVLFESQRLSFTATDCLTFSQLVIAQKDKKEAKQ